ncbi:DUF397 domain-containing protein, partial [Streptomyces durbertensis]
MSSSTPNPRETRWFSSSYSGGQGGQCVQWAPEHARATGEFLVRDSKAPQGPTLLFGVTGWGAFTAALRRGD